MQASPWKSFQTPKALVSWTPNQPPAHAMPRPRTRVPAPARHLGPAPAPAALPWRATHTIRKPEVPSSKVWVIPQRQKDGRLVRSGRHTAQGEAMSGPSQPHVPSCRGGQPREPLVDPM